MRVRVRLVILLLAAGTAAPPLGARAPGARETVDLEAINRIKDEGLARSRVMEIASYLTDVYGPRLTGSPAIREATAWAKATLESWGLSNVHLEPFYFGRGWQNERFTAAVVAPRYFPLIAAPVAWTPGTSGPVVAEAVLADIEREEDFARFRGRLRGKFVLASPLRKVPAHFDPPGHRFTDSELLALSKPRTQAAGRGEPGGDPRARLALERKKDQFWVDEGVAAVIQPGRGDGGTIFVAGRSHATNAPPVAPMVIMAVEHYGRIARMLEKNIPVKLELDIANRFLDEDLNAYNLVADLPGGDKADELVMLGAHLDSWHTGTGATDNAAGAAVVMEAMRILKASGLKVRRTVRLGLWSGEEEGLLGSAAYVREHFGDRRSGELKPDYSKLSVYFNVDNGTGAIRGVYLQGNEAVGPIFEAWMEPFRALGMTTLAARSTGGTDHTTFDAIGLPAFQFIQDPIEYESRTHHSNQDVYERLQADDLARDAAIVAAFAYQAANRLDRLPRKPMPQGFGRGQSGR